MEEFGQELAELFSSSKAMTHCFQEGDPIIIYIFLFTFTFAMTWKFLHETSQNKFSAQIICDKNGAKILHPESGGVWLQTLKLRKKDKDYDQ